MLTPTANLILFKGKKLKDGSHPITLQVKVDTGKYKRISLGLSAKEKDWNATDSRFRDNNKHELDNRDLFDYETKAQTILREMTEEMRRERKKFDFDVFKARFLGKEVPASKPNTVLGFLQWYISYLTEKGRLGDRDTFKALYNVLEQSGTSEKLTLDDVDRDWLEKLEVNILKRVNPHTGKPIKKGSAFSIFKRLKTLFNKAIYFDVTKNYPFKNSANPKGYTFSHLTSPRISKSLSDEQLKLFFSFDWQSEESTRQERMAWKICYFIYLFRGIPISDAARLTKDDIANNQIQFARIKTKRKVPNVPLTEKRKWILDLLSKETDGHHLLPILFKGRHDTEQSKRNRINKIKTWVNSGAKSIAKKQGIDLNISTYVFRHSFARQVLEKYGIWTLKEILAHADVKTTQSYAKSLSDKELEVTDDVFNLV